MAKEVRGMCNESWSTSFAILGEPFKPQKWPASNFYSVITQIKREGKENQGHGHQIEIARNFNKFTQ